MRAVTTDNDEITGKKNCDPHQQLSSYFNQMEQQNVCIAEKWKNNQIELNAAKNSDRRLKAIRKKILSTFVDQQNATNKSKKRDGNSVSLLWSMLDRARIRCVRVFLITLYLCLRALCAHCVTTIELIRCFFLFFISYFFNVNVHTFVVIIRLRICALNATEQHVDGKLINMSYCPCSISFSTVQQPLSIQNPSTIITYEKESMSKFIK